MVKVTSLLKPDGFKLSYEYYDIKLQLMSTYSYKLKRSKCVRVWWEDRGKQEYKEWTYVTKPTHKKALHVDLVRGSHTVSLIYIE